MTELTVLESDQMVVIPMMSTNDPAEPETYTITYMTTDGTATGT